MSATQIFWAVVEPRRKTPEEIDRSNWTAWRVVSVWLTKQEARREVKEGQRLRQITRRVRIAGR